jgi:hypothetical protein
MDLGGACLQLYAPKKTLTKVWNDRLDKLSEPGKSESF